MNWFVIPAFLLGVGVTHCLWNRRYGKDVARWRTWWGEARKQGILEGRALERLQPQVNLSGLPSPDRDEVTP